MGHKVNPISFRILNGNKKSWSSNWYTENKNLYVENIVEDIKIFNYLKKTRSDYMVGKSSIERVGKKIKLLLYSSRASLVIGKKGETITKIESDIRKVIPNQNELNIDVRELRKPNLDANIVARTICDRIEKRQAFKRVAKSIMDEVMRSGAFGVKIICSGRLNGAEIARSETFKQGSVPLHTLRADIDYAADEAKTTYGIIGIRVWICIKVLNV